MHSYLSSVAVNLNWSDCKRSNLPKRRMKKFPSDKSDSKICYLLNSFPKFHSKQQTPNSHKNGRKCVSFRLRNKKLNFANKLQRENRMHSWKQTLFTSFHLWINVFGCHSTVNRIPNWKRNARVFSLSLLSMGSSSNSILFFQHHWQ